MMFSEQLRRPALAIAVATAVSTLQAAEIQSGAATSPAVSAAARSVPETVVVTAQRREQSIQEVPIPITALGADELRDKQLVRADELETFVPSLSAQFPMQKRGTIRYFLRGIGTNNPSEASQSPLGIYVDDVYISQREAHGFPLFDLERVEVLRGPQGTLYGKNTIAGAINFISQKPSFDDGGYAKVGVGNYRTRSAELVLGGGLIPDKLAGRISLYQQNADSWVKNANLGKYVDGHEDAALRAQLLAQLSDDLDVLLSVRTRRDDGGQNNWHRIGRRADGTDNFGWRGEDDPRLIWGSYEGEKEIATDGASITLNWRAPFDLTFTSITAWERLETTSSSSGASPNDTNRSYSDRASRQWTQEFRLASDKDQRLSWITGAHFYREYLDSENYSGATRTGLARVRYTYKPLELVTDSQAAFAALTFQVSDRFKIAGGLRWTRESQDVDMFNVASPFGVLVPDVPKWWEVDYSAYPVAAVQKQDKSWTAVTYDITPEYAVTDHFRVYFRHARGFQSGGFNTSASVDAAVATVDPEYLTEYTLGFKSEWFDDRLIANVAAFYYDYKDPQVFTSPEVVDGGQAVTTLLNAKKAKAYGVEGDFTARITDHVSLNSSIGWLHTEYTDFPLKPAAVGNEFARAPKLTASLGISYEVPVHDGRLRLSGDIRYRSLHYFGPIDQNDRYLEQAGFSLINLNANYSFGEDGKYDLGLWVKNLSDKEYATIGINSSDGAYAAGYGAPREFGATLTVKF